MIDLDENTASYVAPAVFAERMPALPILTSELLGWMDTTVQRYSMSRLAFDVPPARDIRLGFHLAAPLLVGARLGSDEHAPRWLDPDRFNLIPAQTKADWDFRGDPELLLVHLREGLIRSVIAEAYSADPDRVQMPGHLAKPDKEANLLARLLLKEAARSEPGTQLFANMISRALALHLVRRYSSLGPPRPAPTPTISSKRMRRVIEFLHANLADDLSLSQLAKVSGLGPSQFGRAFRAETGQPPHLYLVEIRVKAARHLLEHTTLPVTDVAFRCGFTQSSHFATMFRKVTGMTPREYRMARRA